MAKETIKIGVDVDRETDLVLRKWSKAEGRSKRQHCAIVLKKLARVMSEKPDAARQLGIS